MPSKKDLIKYAIKGLVDELNRLIFVLFIVLFIVSIFIDNFYVDITEILLFIIFIIRIVSKDKDKRKKENAIYLKIRNTIIHPFNRKDSKKKDKESVYKKCNKCKTVLKLPLPKKRGINHAKCPNCGKRLTIINFRKKKVEKIKVEVIKKKRGE